MMRWSSLQRWGLLLWWRMRQQALVSVLDRLTVYLYMSFFVLCSRIFNSDWNLTIAGEVLQNLDLNVCPTLTAFGQCSLLCHTCFDTGPRFSRFRPGTA